MRYLYGAADEKFVQIELNYVRRVISPLSKYKFHLNTLTNGKTYFNKNDIPIVYKCSPDTLLNMCSKVVDAFPLPSVYKWDIDNICHWLRKYGYPQYQNTFRENMINGRTLLLLDASALSAMNIRDFEHIRHIAYGIRSLFYFEMTKFGRSISLAPDFHLELYKLLRIKTGAKYEEVRRTDLWRHMQLLRPKSPNYRHWELLERWMCMVKDPKQYDIIGGTKRYNLYKCSGKVMAAPTPPKRMQRCYCLPPCQCYWSDLDVRPPWRFKCLPHLKPDNEYLLECEGCLPPCTCLWTPKKFITHRVLTCLRTAFPQKYGSPHMHKKLSPTSRLHMYRLSIF